MSVRVGIVGAGQLARMMHQAAIALGIDTVVLAKDPAESAARVAQGVVLGSPDSLEDLRALASRVDVVTFDHELVDPRHLEMLVAEGHVLRPGPETLGIAVDKLVQRERFAAASLPLPAWAEARDATDARRFGDEHGWPVVLKSARGGYDGRGVWVCPEPRDLDDVPGLGDARFLVEEFVRIDRELAVLVARRLGGDERLYPVVETVQRDGVCVETITPARIPGVLADEARAIGAAVAETAGAVGNLAVEMLVRGGRVLINEIAARPHNSGHFSIDACVTSQFENHLRGALDWPLGDTSMTAPAAVMLNIFGGEGVQAPAVSVPKALALPDAHVHWYGKENRPGRKLGHVTVTGDSLDRARVRARQAAAELGVTGGE